MNEQALRFRVGVFVLSSLILLAVLGTLFGGSSSLFKRQDVFYVAVQDASGVGPGTPVRKSGVRIGEVQSIQFDEASNDVLIKIVIEQPYVIHENDVPTLVHGLLGGDTSIDFLPQAVPPADKDNPAGTAPEKMDKVEAHEPADDVEEAQAPPNPAAPVPPGARIPGVNQPDARTLMNDVSRLMPTVESMLKRFDRMTPELEQAIREYRDLAKDSRDTIPAVRRTNDELFVAARYWARVGERLDLFVQANQDKASKLIENSNDTITRIGAVFNDENQRNLAATLKNLKAGTENLDSITKNTDGFLKEGRETMKRVNGSIEETDKVLKNLTQATKPMADRSAAIMHNLDESTQRLNRLTQEARDVLRLFQGPGTFSSLLSDPTLYNNLNEASCMIKMIMPRLDRAMKDMELFADKIARHPEALGLGGVVTPGSGLKR